MLACLLALTVFSSCEKEKVVPQPNLLQGVSIENQYSIKPDTVPTQSCGCTLTINSNKRSSSGPGAINRWIARFEHEAIDGSTEAIIIGGPNADYHYTATNTDLDIVFTTLPGSDFEVDNIGLFYDEFYSGITSVEFQVICGGPYSSSSYSEYEFIYDDGPAPAGTIQSYFEQDTGGHISGKCVSSGFPEDGN